MGSVLTGECSDCGVFRQESGECSDGRVGSSDWRVGSVLTGVQAT